MTYPPDIARYQQLIYGGATGPFDCAAWSGAIVTDAHTNGAIRLSGRAIRLASNEPVPNRTSPGLNVQQVDEAIYRLTDGRVNLWTPTPGSIGRVGVREALVDGRWAHASIDRSVLVRRGYIDGFAGKHGVTAHARPIDNACVIGDPLVGHYYTVSWDAFLDACQAVANDRLIRVSFTRDRTPDYGVRVHPDPGKELKRFLHYYVVDGRVTKREASYTGGFTATCTPPRMYAGRYTRELVRLTDGSREGWYISATYAREE